MNFIKNKKLLYVSVCSSFVVLFFSCKESVSFNKHGYVVGKTYYIKPVDKTSLVQDVPQEIFNAAVLLVTGAVDGSSIKVCSGILVAGKNKTDLLRVVTNAHCFSQQDVKGNIINKLLKTACVKTNVYFGFAPQADEKSEKNNCLQNSLRVDYVADLAVFSLSKQPSEKHKPLGLWDLNMIPKERKAIIVHYPDIKERAHSIVGEKFRVPTASFTVTDCVVIGGFEKSEWKLDSSLPYSLRHTCDLLHGSSGSALVDKVTHKILGINWGGIKINANTKIRKDNVAVAAWYVHEFLNGPIDDKKRDVLIAGIPITGNINAEKQHASANNVLNKKCGVISSVGGNDYTNLAFYIMLGFLFMSLNYIYLIRKKKKK